MKDYKEKREMTGYPSIDKPWMKYYSEEALNAAVFDGSMYSYFVKSSVDRHNDTAVNYFGAKTTYGELIKKIDIAAMAFTREGIESGDFVTSFILRTPEFIQVFYGLNKIGAIADMEYVTLSEKEILKAVKEVKSKIVITTDLVLPKVAMALYDYKEVERIIVVRTISAMPALKRIIASFKIKTELPKDDDRFVLWDEWIKGKEIQVIEKNNSEDTAVIVHTGGTTGVPKGVELTNYNFNSLAVQYKTSIFKNRNGKYLCIAPPFVGFGIGLGMHQPLCCGLELCLDPDPNPENIVSSYLQYKPKHLLVGPPHYINMMHDKRMQRSRFDQIESLGSGGEKLSKALADEINNFFQQRGSNAFVFNGYGMTETGAGGFSEMHDVRKYETAGIPLPFTDVRIEDDDTRKELPYNNVGEIVYSCPSIMKEYFNCTEETADVIQIDAEGKRWIRTGDLGFVDKDGFLFLQGRIKRIYFAQGSDGSIYKLFPSYIESVIMKYEDAVKQCGVIAVTEDNKYYKPIAFAVKRRDDVTEADIKSFCVENMEEYSVPNKVIFVDSIPTTTIGKINYLQLEEEYKNITA